MSKDVVVNKAGYSIDKMGKDKVVVSVGDKSFDFDLGNEQVLLNLVGRGVKRYMDAAKAGKDAGKDTFEALEKAASDMSKGIIGRASFDLVGFLKSVESAKTLEDVTLLNKQVINAPKREQAALAIKISDKTLKIALG